MAGLVQTRVVVARGEVDGDEVGHGARATPDD